MNIKVSIVGATGRMGRELAHLMTENPRRWSLLSEGKELVKAGSDLVIDFSSPEGFREMIKASAKKPTAVVSGTTGLSEKDLAAFRKLGKSAPVFWAPNTSLGVATLKKALAALSALDDYDFQVEEIHHRFKKDAPSGTAKLLKSELDSVVGKKTPEALAIRGGGVPGLHRIWALGPEEWLCFEHMALDRRVFARGALKVGEWLVKQKPGVYTMEDYLNHSGSPKTAKKTRKR